jgi:hypothetical protein
MTYWAWESSSTNVSVAAPRDKIHCHASVSCFQPYNAWVIQPNLTETHWWSWVGQPAVQGIASFSCWSRNTIYFMKYYWACSKLSREIDQNITCNSWANTTKFLNHFKCNTRTKVVSASKGPTVLMYYYWLINSSIIDSTTDIQGPNIQDSLLVPEILTQIKGLALAPVYICLLTIWLSILFWILSYVSMVSGTCWPANDLCYLCFGFLDYLLKEQIHSG